ncbi:hypothetical protein LX32DRAFT_723176 [Colletotrichum zoysiae]|uniref:DUF7918 domain-containing protein n=1 Tax=Colletotrichum zoysiae TaxID=1216348 RepID=A0AAD9HFD0_9PEZI|nr:hypothetical protein LX32DRAFT_723176 [Colletotrichum zoysiae]
MAVIDGLPGVKVSIRLNGSGDDCPEYDDPKPPPTPASSGVATHSISKVIESKDDANFSVHFEVKDAHRWIHGNRGLSVHIYVDGQTVRKLVCGEHLLKGQVLQRHEEGVKEASTNPEKCILKPFMFAKIKQVDEGGARVTEDLKVVKHLGNIEVIIFRANVHGKADWKPTNAMSKTELAEKAMKGKNLSHGTGFSEGREIPKVSNVNCTYPDGNVRLARFIFRYKSKMALQVEGIIPRDPSPKSLPKPRPRNAADLSQEELQRLAQERLDQLAMVKLESNVGVKREADDDIKPRMSKVYKTAANGAVDLTD